MTVCMTVYDAAGVGADVVDHLLADQVCAEANSNMKALVYAHHLMTVVNSHNELLKEPACFTFPECPIMIQTMALDIVY